MSELMAKQKVVKEAIMKVENLGVALDQAQQRISELQYENESSKLLRGPASSRCTTKTKRQANRLDREGGCQPPLDHEVACAAGRPCRLMKSSSGRAAAAGAGWETMMLSSRSYAGRRQR